MKILHQRTKSLLLLKYIQEYIQGNALAADAGGFTLMDFGEFLEAFAQIAHRKFVGHDLKFHEKFEKLIHLTSAYIEHYKSKWIKETKMVKVDFGLDEVIVDKTTDIHDNPATMDWTS